MSITYEHIPSLDNPFLDSMQWGQLIKTVEQMRWSYENKPISSDSRAKLRRSVLEAQQNIRKRVVTASSSTDMDFWDRMRGATCWIPSIRAKGTIEGAGRMGGSIKVIIQHDEESRHTHDFFPGQLEITLDYKILSGL